ncbi:hypothetical protein [Roseateles violae]|uniref:Uncharacterized protein n=1 Tax=Roseateles violae TaxID=3058042 RepID=A0ABT8DWP3_9BURK|nr:hypothetical protein [Pelomonas sp. PFR6]MDN3921495.1 hypothetical protein [Pelomonas sp. PFR6]
MSGALNPTLSGAATGHAMRAKAGAMGVSIGEAVRDNFLKSMGEHRPPKRESLPARTWAGIPESTRLLIVMVACEAPGEPQRLCRQPWDSFSATDQCRMASSARALRRDLRDVSSLF